MLSNEYVIYPSWFFKKENAFKKWRAMIQYSNLVYYLGPPHNEITTKNYEKIQK